MACRMLYARSYLCDERDVNIHRAVVKDHYAMHTHDFIEMVLITSGEGIHTVGEESYRLKKGDMFILNSDVPHAYKADSGSPLIVYNCLFKPASIDSALGDGRDFIKAMYESMTCAFAEFSGSKNYVKLQGGSMDIEMLFNGIYQEYQHKEPGYAHMVRADLSRILVLIFRKYRAECQKHSYSFVFRRLAIDTAVRYMQEHYRERISNAELASLAYLSEGYFSRIFKAQTGMSATQMLQSIRIERAKELLQTTAYSVEKIMSMIGYADRKHFYAVFTKCTGKTPGEYRKP